MDRTYITRIDLKKNFLKEVIMRLDFQGVLQAEMERILIDAKPFLKERLFNRYEEKIGSQIINNGQSIADVKSQVVYAFTAETLGYTIELSNTFVLLIVRSKTYIPFDKYSDIFSQVVSIYKQKIDFFTVKRFGLRKINFCFIKNREDINNYFEDSYYNCVTPIDGYESQTTQQRSRLSDGKTNINMRYTIDEGQVGEERYYKVTLDSDIYMTDQQAITNVVFNDSEMKATNDKLFRIYLNVLTEKFLDILTSDEEIETDLMLGVDQNE